MRDGTRFQIDAFPRSHVQGLGSRGAPWYFRLHVIGAHRVRTPFPNSASQASSEFAGRKQGSCRMHPASSCQQGSQMRGSCENSQQGTLVNRALFPPQHRCFIHKNPMYSTRKPLSPSICSKDLRTFTQGQGLKLPAYRAPPTHYLSSCHDLRGCYQALTGAMPAFF